jgi:TatD DNase family protein
MVFSNTLFIARIKQQSREATKPSPTALLCLRVGNSFARMALRLYDAHNHLQDDRFGGRQAELLTACAQTGVARMVVNGACEEDWPQVLALAKKFGGASVLASRVIPSFGYHPWYLHERTADWLKNLTHFLDAVPSAVGEIGLDRWKPGLPYAGQEEAFIAQLRLAVERNLPVSIHCLQAWGRMLEILQHEPRPERGFLLHSYNGSQEMVKPFADLGAYFSFPGYFTHQRKEKQRETFRHVPADRLLIETDAPDQLLPPRQKEKGKGQKEICGAEEFPLTDEKTGKAINHPANLAAIYDCVAELRGVPLEELAAQVEQNFLRLFGGL